ncbi:unnamed protein product [Sphenostylis stenocarpa]|uniref:Uncharacterized protein n=1 Tax=Sphenostylis stenocarpa TaxID=92480 RepID=A0AA86VJC5_9FABA|nr:unnamed protein product [Sphenostylis stenocarpa]
MDPNAIKIRPSTWVAYVNYVVVQPLTTHHVSGSAGLGDDGFVTVFYGPWIVEWAIPQEMVGFGRSGPLGPRSNSARLRPVSASKSILCYAFILSHLLRFVLGNASGYGYGYGYGICFVSERMRKVETWRLHNITNGPQ